MAAVSSPEIKPAEQISAKAVPEAIRRAVRHIFSNCGDGLWLVGGTALAGYYAEHRRSDDIDLFSADPEIHRMAVLAVKSLQTIGASFSNEKQTPFYYRANAKFLDHSFTIDVVLDEHIHSIGSAIRTPDGTLVADIKTLLAMKVACLISRCSEKDLFDLAWIFSKIGEPGAADLIAIGVAIDGGISAETLLISLHGANLKKEACHFLLPKSEMNVDEAYRKITGLKKKLINSLLEYEKAIPLSPETKAIRQTYKDLKRLRRT